jgi:hypothetical protein
MKTVGAHVSLVVTFADYDLMASLRASSYARTDGNGADPPCALCGHTSKPLPTCIVYNW